MSPASLASKLERAAASGKLPKVIVPVHFGGLPCDMPAIGALARRYGVRIIEDASHAIGGSYEQGKVGCGTYADVTVFSFHPVKVVTTAEGGACLTNDTRLAARMRRLRSHGMTREAAELSVPSPGLWYYEQHELGFNYRLTDLQAALGSSQLARIERFVARRHELADAYDRAFADLPVQLPVRREGGISGLHLYVILNRHPRKERSQLFAELRAAGIGVNVHYIPVHLQPYYRALGFRPGDFPESERYYASAVTLPLYPSMSDADQARVVAAVREALGGV
jgi:dTDP-4-amino-4,6-dideoxygalactose transaminase